MARMCKQRYDVMTSHVDFESASNPEKTYRVYAFRDGEVPMCTCFPFLTARKKAAKANGIPTNEALGTCKHLKQVMAETCQWTERDGHGGAIGYAYDDTCPNCGGPVVDTDSHAPSADDRANIIESLASLHAEMEKDDPSFPDPERIVEKLSRLAAS